MNYEPTPQHPQINTITKETDSSFMNYFQHIGDSPSNLFGELFSSVFGIMNWFIGLRWYVILLIVVMGSYLFIQMEYAIETRRQTKGIKRENENAEKGTEKEKEKEGMEEYNNAKIKGIIRQNNVETTKKRVSFYNAEHTSNIMTNSIAQVYNLWVLPWIYVIFRNTGFR